MEEEQPQQLFDELQFYSRCSKPLIFNLRDNHDRALAASWVKKIRDEAAGTEALRTEYMKLLLFALQRGHLVGIFADDPTAYDQLEPFPPEFDLNGFAKILVEKEQTERQNRIRQQLRGETGDFPPYTTDCSSDFREYVAAQDIPGFGVHCYYAISSEPVNLWHRAERGIFPKLARSAVDTSNATPPGVTARKSDPTCACASKEVETEEDADAECACKKAAKEPTPKKKKRAGKRFGKSPPTNPLGTPPPPEDRPPPTWGSNLIKIQDAPKKKDDEEEEPAPFDADDEAFGLTEAMSGIDQFVEEFKKGTMDKSPRKPQSPHRAESTRIGTSGAGEGRMEEGEDEGEQEEMDMNASQRMDDIKEDSQLVEYFKEQSNQSATKKHIALVTQEDQASTPARGGLPLSTPKPSPSPKRPVSSERLYEEESGEPAKKSPTKSPNVSVGDFDDDELAELGMTREEAKKLLATDVFQISGVGDDLLPDDDEVDEDFEDEAGASPVDDEFEEWDKRLRELEREAEEELREHAENIGLDRHALDDLEVVDLAILDAEDEEGGAPCADVCAAVCAPPAPRAPTPPRPPSPKKPPTPQKPPSPEKPPEQKPDAKGGKKTGKEAKGAKGKTSKTKVAKGTQAKPPAGTKVAKGTQAKPPPAAKGKPSQTKIAKGKPSESKIAKASQTKTSQSKIAQSKASESKLPQKGSKLQKPSASKLQPPKVTPLKKGSPEATPVLSEFERLMKIRAQVAAALQEVEPDYPPDVERTPPMFSRHPGVREAAQGLVYAPDEFGLEEEIDWQHGPDFFENVPDFVPFDPRQQGQVEEVFPGVEDRQYGEEIFFDAEAEPILFDEVEEIDEAPPSPEQQQFEEMYQYSKLEDALYDTAVDYTCLPCESPEKSPVKPPQFQTDTHDLPEPVSFAATHQQVKTPSPRRQLFPPRAASPPSGTRQHFTPPMAPPSSQPPCPCSPEATQTTQRVPSPQKLPTPQRATTPPKSASPSKSASPQRIPIPQRQPSPDQFYTPAAHKRVSPQNFYTAQEFSPEFMSILQDGSPKQILDVQASPDFSSSSPPCSPCSADNLGIDNFPEGFGGGDLFGEGEEAPEYFDQLLEEGYEEAAGPSAPTGPSSPTGPCAPTGPCGPSFASMEKEIADVGFSVVETEPKQFAALDPQYASYKSPPKKLMKTDRQKLKEREEKYIDFLFCNDKDTLEMLKRAVALVADVEQEEEDPYHVLPQSPPPLAASDEIDDGSQLYSEEFPEIEGISPPPSPIKGDGVCAGTSSGDISSTSTPAVSRLPPPKFGRPPPGGRTIPPPKSGLRPPCAGAQPKSGIPPPGGRPSGIPPPGGRPSGIPPPGGRPSGIPPPGGRPSGIPPPGGRPSGIPPPGGRPCGIPPPGGRPSGIPPPGSRLQPPASRIAQPAGRGLRPPSTGKYQLQIPQLNKSQQQPEPPCAPCTSSRGPATSGLRQPQAIGKQKKPQRPPTAADLKLAEFVPKAKYKGPPGPAYFPPSDAAEWPAIRPGFKQELERHQIDDVFYDERRPLLNARNVVVGKTSARRKKIQRVSDPRMPPCRPPVKLTSDFPRRHGQIDEDEEESPLPQRAYGVPGIQVPPRPVLQAPPSWASMPVAPTPTTRQIKPPGTSLQAPCSGGAASVSKLRPPSGGVSGLRPPSGGGSGLRPPSAGRTPPVSQLRPPSGSKLQPPSQSKLRPPSQISKLKPPTPARPPSPPKPTAAPPPCGVCESDEWDIYKQIEAELKAWKPTTSQEDAKRIAEEVTQNLSPIKINYFAGLPDIEDEDEPCPCAGDEEEPQGAGEAFGRHTSKGFKPAHGRKVQYPIPEPQDTPPQSPIPWWEVETPTPPPPPPFVPPPRSPEPDPGYAGYFGSPRPGPSQARTPSPQKYVPPDYDEGMEGLKEESPPCICSMEDEDLQIGGGKRQVSPSRLASVKTPPRREEVKQQPQRPKRTRLTSDAGRRKLDFDVLGSEHTDIADDYIEGLMDRYDEDLPPLPPGSRSPQSPCRPPPAVGGWQIQEEQVMPRPKTQTPKQQQQQQQRKPDMKPHEWFSNLPKDIDESFGIETTSSPLIQGALLSPKVKTPPRPAQSPRAASPRAPSPRGPSPSGPSPRGPSPRGPSPRVSPQGVDVSGGSEMDRSLECLPCSPLTSPGSRRVAEDIFSEAGVPYSPPKLPPPSPPSPLSTQAAMQDMLTNVRGAAGRTGIQRKKMFASDYQPMQPIKEMVTQPGMGRLGLPGVVQIDLETIGTGSEEPCPCSPYIPPTRPPPHMEEEMYSEEEEEEEEDVYEEGAPFTEEDLQAVAPTSPLAKYQLKTATPPKGSPTFDIPTDGPILADMDMSFDDYSCYVCPGSPEYSTPPRPAQVTPKPSPMLTPGASPRRTPPPSPKLPYVRPEDTFLTALPSSPDYMSEYMSPEYMSPEYISPQRPPKRAPSPQQSPQYMSPEWAATPCGPCGSPEDVPAQTDEMGLPNLVDLYAQHMGPIYASPTEERQRQIIYQQPEQRQATPQRSPYQYQNIQLDALPVSDEQVDVNIPIAPLDPYVEKDIDDQYYLPPMGVQDIFGEQDPYESFDEECAPCASPPRPPSPAIQSPRTPPGTGQMWDNLLQKSTNVCNIGDQPEFAPSPEQLSPRRPPSPAQSPQYMSPAWIEEAASMRSPQTQQGGSPPCGSPRRTSPGQQAQRPPSASPARSPMTIRSPQQQQMAGSPQQQQMARSPQQQQMTRSPQQQQMARSPQQQQMGRSPQQQMARSPQQQMAASPPRPPSPRTPPRPQSPIVMPELSPFRMPQPEERQARTPERVVTQTVTERRFVTVLPPQPTFSPEFRQQIEGAFDVSHGSGYSDSFGILEEDADFKWMD